MRSGIVVNEIPLISSTSARGNANGSQVLTNGSLVAAGLNFPRLLRSLNALCPKGVSEGISPSLKSGTPAPERGPAHVPFKSRTGAGPPVPTTLLRPLYIHSEFFPAACGWGVWADATDESPRTAAKAMMTLLPGLRIRFSCEIRPLRHRVESQKGSVEKIALRFVLCECRSIRSTILTVKIRAFRRSRALLVSLGGLLVWGSQVYSVEPA